MSVSIIPCQDLQSFSPFGCHLQQVTRLRCVWVKTCLECFQVFIILFWHWPGRWWATVQTGDLLGGCSCTASSRHPGAISQQCTPSANFVHYTHGLLRDKALATSVGIFGTWPFAYIFPSFAAATGVANFTSCGACFGTNCWTQSRANCWTRHACWPCRTIIHTASSGDHWTTWTSCTSTASVGHHSSRRFPQIASWCSCGSWTCRSARSPRWFDSTCEWCPHDSALGASTLWTSTRLFRNAQHWFKGSLCWWLQTMCFLACQRVPQRCYVPILSPLWSWWEEAPTESKEGIVQRRCVGGCAVYVLHPCDMGMEQVSLLHD